MLRRLGVVDGVNAADQCYFRKRRRVVLDGAARAELVPLSFYCGDPGGQINVASMYPTDPFL